LVVTEAKENPPQNVEEAKCLLALVRAEREVRRAEAQLADRLVTKDHAWTEYSRLKAANAQKRLGDAELMVGRARSILSENGFSCSELTLSMRRSEATDHDFRQQLGATSYSFTILMLISRLYSSVYSTVGLNHLSIIYESNMYCVANVTMLCQYML
jgi:hypothetical protein